MDSLKILVVGSGGREHALAWRCRHEGHTVLAAPGSDGMAAEASCHPVQASDRQGLVELARGQAVDLVVIGPEQPLVDGLADDLRAAGIATVGPSAAAARLEGSKADAKAFMARHGVPTARHVVIDDLPTGLEALRSFEAPPVVKADGLAAGKGVTVCDTFEQAEAAIRSCTEQRKFGEAGARVVLEQRLEGEEVSIFAITDGSHAVLLPSAQDHKRLLDGDRGPNTGGMGAYCPAPVYREPVAELVRSSIVAPTLAGLRQESRPFVGVLFFGLMMDRRGKPWVIEYNCRFGDPEAQPLLFGLQQPLVPQLWGAARGELQDGQLRGQPAATVVLASAGYPESSSRGDPIEGLEHATGPDLHVFHAGTRHTDAGWVTAGGRVLGVCARGASLGQALQKAYGVAERIHIPGGQMRRDIGARLR